VLRPAALYLTLINLPMMIVSFSLGYDFRVTRIIAASSYTFATSILFAPIVLVLRYLSYQIFASEPTLRSVWSWLAFAVFAFITIRSFKLMGVAHGMSGYRFALLNFLISVIPLIIIDQSTEATSVWRRSTMVLEQPIHIYNVPSGSMNPALPVGAEILVNQMLPISQIRVGDIVTFYLPKDNETTYIKRIVGQAGDRIQMRDGLLYINDKSVQRERMSDFIGEDPCGSDATARVKRWKETLPNGVSYETLDCVDNGFYDNTDVYTVPPNHFFMMGDNRDNSTDSRVLSAVGYVPTKNVTGKAYFVLYPLDRGYLYNAKSE
jgi:signal peptidase I